MLKALLLDFDGLLYDTETAAYFTWEELYGRHGARLSRELWREVIGRPPGASGFDPIDELERQTGTTLDRVTTRAERDARKRELLPERLMDGAAALLSDARSAGLLTAIVTSNSRANVDRHLARAGVEHPFDAIVCADGDPVRGKPSPTLYLEALTRLALDPGEAIALEDSPNGIAAAKAAGLYTIAVPNDLTRRAPGLEAADRLLSSLTELELPQPTRG